MTTKQNNEATKTTWLALEAADKWVTAQELGASEEDLHWLTDKLWAQRKLVQEVWLFRACL